MAVRHRLIRRPPQAVWAVLADPDRYGEWVVGPSRSEPLDPHWPSEGSRLRYTLRLGPWQVEGTTVVRHAVAGRELELEAAFKKLGTARILIELRPWGEETLVICDEHPLRGIGGTLHNPLSEALLQLRHRGMLARLAAVVGLEIPVESASAVRPGRHAHPLGDPKFRPTAEKDPPGLD